MLWDSYMLIKVMIYTTSFLSPSSLSSFIPLSHFFCFCVFILFKRCCDIFISLLPLVIVILRSLLHPLSLSFHFPFPSTSQAVPVILLLFRTSLRHLKTVAQTISFNTEHVLVLDWLPWPLEMRSVSSTVMTSTIALSHLILSYLLCKFILSVVIQ